MDRIQIDPIATARQRYLTDGEVYPQLDWILAAHYLQKVNEGRIFMMVITITDPEDNHAIRESAADAGIVTSQDHHHRAGRQVP